MSRTAQALGAAAAGAGALCLAGWASDSLPLMSLLPWSVPMNPATALGFLGLGGALICLAPRLGGGDARRLGYTLAALVASAGLLKLGVLAGMDPGFDRWLFAEKLASVPHGPNRMAPNTALGMMLAGAALLLLDRRTARGGRPSEILAAGVLALSYLTLLGYSYGQMTLAGIPSYIPMAANTAAAFAAVAAGVLFARRDEGWMALLSDAGPVGLALRRLLPTALAVPGLLGWLRLKGESAGMFQGDFGTALSAAACTAVLAALVLWSASAQWRLQREREQAGESLKAANAELEAFSYSVSHDLRAPLRAVDGFARILQAEHAEGLDGEGRRLLGIILASGRSMGQMIDDLLEFSRAGRQQLRHLPVDMTALARSVAAETAPESLSRIEVADLPSAKGDPSVLRQVFQNLIGNAVKYSSRRPEPRIEIGSTSAERGACYYVRDNGAGFDMRYADKLFGVFSRLHRKDEFEGTGVGLAIVDRIVRRHGGRVWAEGRVGEGATFYFTLP